MHVIGLTGNIASGKSDVCARLKELGARVISADEVARKVVLPGSEGARRIREAFGPGVFLPDGRLDRAALGRTVFGDGEARRRLNALLHPLIIADVQSTLDAIAGEDPGAVAVLEAPLLIEAGMQGMADPFNRATYPWGKEDGELLRHYRALARLRGTLPALKRGLASFAAAGPDVFCVLRATQNRRDAFGNPAPNQRALALVNRAPEPRQVRLASGLFREGPHRIALTGSFIEAFSGRRARVKDGVLEWTLPPLGQALLVQAENI